MSFQNPARCFSASPRGISEDATDSAGDRGRPVPNDAKTERNLQERRPVTTIYVGNLDYTVTSDDLRALFEPFGSIALAEVQVKSRTGRSRGFGMVEMLDESAGRAAIKAPRGAAPAAVSSSTPTAASSRTTTSSIARSASPSSCRTGGHCWRASSARIRTPTSP